MTNSKATKKALFMSVMSLLLCFTMLMGATFAWFTDTVKSSNNKIQAGSLQVGLEMFDGTQYIDIGEESSPIFGTGSIAQNNNAETLWEPGKTQVAYLKIVNNGTLNLKYRVDVEVASDDGKDMYKVMRYAIIPNVKDGEGVASWDASIGKEVSIGINETDFLDMHLAPDGEHYFALAIHMQEEAGNEYQNGEVSFDIIVNATQKDAESDSFGPDYDKGLTPPVEDEGAIRKEAENGLGVYYLTNGEVLLDYDAETYTGTEVLDVPNVVTALPNKALNGDTFIKEVSIPLSVNDFGGTPNETGTGASGGFFYKSSVEKVTLPEGLTEIPAAAFNQAANLTEVNIPSTVTTIGINAFAGSGLKELNIPATVTNIGYGAFRDMANLEKVTITGDAVHIPNYAFRSCAKLTEIYLKVNSLTLGDNMIFTNTGTNNENPNNITIYVYNDDVFNTLTSNKNIKCTIVKETE